MEDDPYALVEFMVGDVSVQGRPYEFSGEYPDVTPTKYILQCPNCTASIWVGASEHVSCTECGQGTLPEFESPFQDPLDSGVFSGINLIK